MSKCLSVLVVATITLTTCPAADWNQWRGSNRNGVADSSPALLDSIPKTGLKPVWISETIGSGKNGGGWGSPVVVDGIKNADGTVEQRVYLFAHKRIQLHEIGARKFPWLAPEKRTGMTAEEYQKYEVDRRNEDEARAKAFTFHETIYCLNAETGKTIWKNERDSNYSRFPQSGSPTVADGRVYVLGVGRRARCLDAATGDDVWDVRLEGEFRDEFYQSSIAIIDDVAVFLNGHLIGLDAKTGKTLWQGDAKKTRGSHNSPVIWKTDGRELVIVNVAGKDTICVDPKTGDELWRIESQANYSTPVVAGDRLVTFGNSRKKGLRCFEISLDGAKHVWTYNGVADKGSSPVVVGDYVYVQGEKRLACVNLETGESEWFTMLDRARPQYTSLIAADDKVFYALEGLLCFAADPSDFDPLIDAKMDKSGLMASEQQFRKLLNLDAIEKQPNGKRKAEKLYQSQIGQHGPLPCATPAIADGKIYIRLKNSIACYDLRN